MQNVDPTAQPITYYSKAVSSLCRSANTFQQAIKRRTILQMIGQERQRREHIEQLRQERMDNIFRNKNSNKMDMSALQSYRRQELEMLRDRNSILRKASRRSIEEARRLDAERKRESAESIKTLIEGSHRMGHLRKNRQMKESFISVKERYCMDRQAIANRQLSNQSYRGSVMLQNSKEVKSMLRRARKYQSMVEELKAEAKDNLTVSRFE